ncbi:hypothetical protein D3C78_1890650 [compost metagenome]
MTHDVVGLPYKFFPGKAGELAKQVVDIGDGALQVGGRDHHHFVQCRQQLGGIEGLAHGRFLLINFAVNVTADVTYPS